MYVLWVLLVSYIPDLCVAGRCKPEGARRTDGTCNEGI